MAVQQGELAATDTTKDMASFYSDAVVTTVGDVDRIIHNATQFVRLVLQRPQVELSQGGNTGSPTATVDRPHYTDGLLTAFPTAATNLLLFGFGTNVKTVTVVVFSTSFVDPTSSKWKVQSSLNNLTAEFDNSNFDAAISSVTQSIESGQFKYSILVGVPAVDTTLDGLPFWRITHTDAGSFNDVTEVEIIPPLTPTLTYFDTDGSFASSFSFEKSNILDACFDTTVSPNGVFYTIRFNDQTVGSTSLDPSDDFSDADAGTAEFTNNFNSARWNESSSNSAFLRVSDVLSYNVATGKGQLETTYALGGDFDVSILVNPQTLTTENMWFTIRTLDADNKVIASEGVGFADGVVLPTTSGVFFATYVSNFTNSTADCDLKEARPLWHNTASGTDSFTVAFSGSDWTVSGSQTGALTNAQTGVLYDETVDANTPLEFLISCSATPSAGEKFTFDVITENSKKDPLATDTIGVTRSGVFQTTRQVLTATGTFGMASDDVNIELFGNTDGTVNISADDYEVTITGSAIFPDIAVFTIEKTDAEGDIVGSPLIESFDVIGDSSKNYNDFLDGRVQIACSSSGSSGGGHIYVKIDNVLYKYLNNISLTSEDGSSAVISTTAQVDKDGNHSLAWTRESGIGALPFLTYVRFEESLDIIHLQTIDKDTLLDTTNTKEVLLDISNYEINQFRVFYDQNDFDTLYFVDGSTNLQSFNLDDRISAFMSVNAEDTTLPAGTAQSTDVNADVINAWGEALDGKSVTFAVTAGDGAVTPSTDTTISGGRATTQFTVGSTVGVSTVTATVTET